MKPRSTCKQGSFERRPGLLPLLFCPFYSRAQGKEHPGSAQKTKNISLDCNPVRSTVKHTVPRIPEFSPPTFRKRTNNRSSGKKAGRNKPRMKSEARKPTRQNKKQNARDQSTRTNLRLGFPNRLTGPALVPMPQEKNPRQPTKRPKTSMEPPRREQTTTV